MAAAFCCWRLCLVFLRVSRLLPILVVLAVVSFAYYAFCFHTVFALTNQLSVRFLIYGVFHFLLFMFLISYFTSIFTPVPKIPKKFYLPKELAFHLKFEKNEVERNALLYKHAFDNSISILNVSCTDGPRYCATCQCIKPDRAHHCSVCGKCILRYDHHCPWINNCVHHYNYKYFLLFLFYGLALCSFVFATSAPTLIISWPDEMKSYKVIHKFIVVFLPFVALLFGLSLGCLFFYHVFLVARNRTTMEQWTPPRFDYGPDSYAYHLGAQRNFQQIFGNSLLCWLIPVFTSLSNGLNYPLQEDLTLLQSGHTSSRGSMNGVYYSCSTESVAAAVNGVRSDGHQFNKWIQFQTSRWSEVSGSATTSEKSIFVINYLTGSVWLIDFYPINTVIWTDEKSF